MKAWVEYIHGHNPNLLWDNNRNNDYGDWLNVDAEMPKDVLATAYFAHSTDLVAKSAAILGNTADAEKYGQLYKDISAAFVKAYVAEDGKIKGDTQTCYLLALSFGLLPDEMRPLAVQHLVDNIHGRQDHLSTGFLGVRLLNPVLTQHDHLDLAYKLLETKTYPSWLYPIENGATTIWERWDGWTKEKGFQNPGMNSFNHYSLGSVGEWLYSTVGGIDMSSPGFKDVVIHPRPGGGLTYANCSFNSSYGPITCDWKKTTSGYEINVKVPANSSALVYVPAVAPTAVTESGTPVASAPGVEFVKMEDGAAVFKVGAGSYAFQTPG
jgi:alpha-L-rhamnosidase